MAASRRRLSKGSNLLSIPFEDEVEENEIDPMAEINSGIGSSRSSNSRNSGNGRRGSLFGVLKNSSPSKIAAEQVRLADMYKTVIKLSTENKINEKNSWSLDLIDHMGAIIKEESQGTRGVNFQKASCTLDASVKIYSNRVDDTYATSHRILESLSRNGNDEEATDPDAPKKAARVGSNKNSNRLNITNTIEKNIDVLNAVKVENDQVVDPAFQQMSLAFDEGGAKGMLLSNLRVNQQDCTLVFASLHDKEDISPSMIDYNSINASSLFADINISYDHKLTICPGFDDYRKTLNIIDCSVGMMSISHMIEELKSCMTSSISSSMIIDASSYKHDHAVDAEPMIRPYSDDNDCHDDYEPAAYDKDDNAINNDNDDDVVSSRLSILPSTSASSNDATSAKAATKIQWNAVFGESSSHDGRSSSSHDMMSTSDHITSSSPPSSSHDTNMDWEHVPVISNNDYAFVNLDILNKTNAWAGAKHWKYATRSRNKTDTHHINNDDKHVTEDYASTMVEAHDADDHKTSSNKKSSSKKEKFMIDFLNMTSSSIDQSIFAHPTISSRSKSDPTQLTSAAIEKMEASSYDLLLPSDAKVSIQDLCRLFILPNLILPPPPSADVLRNAVMNISHAHVSSNNMHRRHDVIWGQSRAMSSSSSSRYHQLKLGGDMMDDMQGYDNDHGYAEDAGYDDDDNYVMARENDSAQKMTADHILSNGLVQASRIVEKIQVNYATSAKRVNVRKLKHDIWNHLDDQLVDVGNENQENNRPNMSALSTKSDNTKKDKSSQQEKMSFKGMLRDLSCSQSQKEATLPFYFICLLHLANEKVLKIENPAGRDMSDLIISKDV